MWRLLHREALVMMVFVIASECGLVVGYWVEWLELVFERSLAVLMVSLVLDLFVCTLAAVPKTVIVASRVYVWIFLCSVLCFRKKVNIPIAISRNKSLSDNGSDRLGSSKDT